MFGGFIFDDNVWPVRQTAQRDGFSEAMRLPTAYPRSPVTSLLKSGLRLDFSADITSEGHFICSRTGHFLYNDKLSVCPLHRHSLGLGWRRPVFCQFPGRVCKAKPFRACDMQMSQYLLYEKGCLVPVGSGKCYYAYVFDVSGRIFSISVTKFRHITYFRHFFSVLGIDQFQLTIDRLCLRGQVYSTSPTELSEDIFVYCMFYFLFMQICVVSVERKYTRIFTFNDKEILTQIFIFIVRAPVSVTLRFR
jgi:hypothetical protein